MFTVHCSWSEVGGKVLKACQDLHISKNNMRVIQMGKGVVVLKDTDCTKPCEEKEILKALGIVKTADKRSVSISVQPDGEVKQNRKTVFFTDDFGEVMSAYSLTADQIRLLEELVRQEYLSDAIRVTAQNQIEVVEI